MATPAELNRLAEEARTLKGAALGQLAVKVLELQTADKLRLAASLLDMNCVDLAETIGRRACDEIQLAKLLAGEAVKK